MPTTYPKAEQLSIGYDPKEDRLILVARLQNGENRKLFITRRLLSMMLDKMKDEIAASHPVAERSSDPNEVLQMEHVAAVNQGTSKKSSDKSGSETSPTESHLVTEAQILTQDQHLILGLLAEDKTPIAGIELDRGKAHLILRNLVEQAEKAEWGLEKKAAWMEPIRYGKGGN